MNITTLTFHCFIASVLWFNFHFMESICHFYSFCAPFQVFELVQFMCRPGESALGG
jgi:hypothetical protein